jgi:hypothetical protein
MLATLRGACDPQKINPEPSVRDSALEVIEELGRGGMGFFKARQKP